MGNKFCLMEQVQSSETLERLGLYPAGACLVLWNGPARRTWECGYFCTVGQAAIL